VVQNGILGIVTNIELHVYLELSYVCDGQCELPKMFFEKRKNFFMWTFMSNATIRPMMLSHVDHLCDPEFK